MVQDHLMTLLAPTLTQKGGAALRKGAKDMIQVALKSPKFFVDIILMLIRNITHASASYNTTIPRQYTMESIIPKYNRQYFQQFPICRKWR